MSIESARAFVERVKTDQEFAKRVAEASCRRERAEIARSEGFDFTPEELKAVTGELSEEELEVAAGGNWGCGSTHESEHHPCPAPLPNQCIVAKVLTQWRTGVVARSPDRAADTTEGLHSSLINICGDLRSTE